MQILAVVRTGLVVCLSLLLVFSLAQAQLTQISPNEATIVANNWLTLGKELGWGWQSASVFDRASAHELRFERDVLGYYFETGSEGYIVVAAYRELPPITAYSTSSRFDVAQEDGFARMLKESLARKTELVRSSFSAPAGSPEWANVSAQVDADELAWTSYSGSYGALTQFLETENRRLNPRDSGRRYALDDINPLLSTSWHQSAPYNNFCPNGDGGTTLVGCVATACAQIMSYWRWPGNGTGTYTYPWDGDQSCQGTFPGQNLSATYSDVYDWANILNGYAGGESQAQRDAVAELCYEVGVVHQMDYGVCSSGAWFQMSNFVQHYRYSTAINQQNRSDYASADDWFGMLRTELDSLRPIWYAIGDSGCQNFCHAIVCDGWRIAGTNQIHMNYGWDDSHTAWYTVDNLFCGGNACDPAVETAIRRIYPDLTTYDRSIVSAEYFFDSDPGPGLGHPIAVYPDDETTLVSAIQLSGQQLGVGQHRLYLRYRDSRGIWSAAEGRAFYVTPAGPVGNPIINQAEVFYDNDPGAGNGEYIPVSSDDEVTLVSSHNVGALDPGFHRMYLRYRTNGNVWSAAEGRSVYITPPLPEGDQLLALAEYFLDNDPGLGQGHAVDFPDAADVVLTNAITPFITTVGAHRLYLRYQTAGGVWSAAEGRGLYCTPWQSDSLFIAGGEAFLDSAGAYGAGLAMIPDDGAFDENEEDMHKNQVAAAITPGWHYVYSRVVDNRGLWSSVVRDSFLLGVPQDIRLVVQPYNGGENIRLVWTSFPAAVEYRIHYDSVATGSFTNYLSIPATDTTVTVPTILSPGRRFYRVVAIMPTRLARRDPADPTWLPVTKSASKIQAQ